MDSVANTTEIQPPPKDHPAIDPEVIKLNLEALGEEAAECLSFLTETFFEESPQILEKMRLAAEQGNAEQLRFHAHTFKSNGATLGAAHLTALCLELETKARTQDLSSSMALVQSISSEFQRVKAALKEFQW